MIKKYKKKPVIIEAMLWTGTNQEEAYAFMKDAFVSFNSANRSIAIKTLEGTMYGIMPGDYIIKGVMGEFYPIKPDIFEGSYEEVK